MEAPDVFESQNVGWIESKRSVKSLPKELVDPITPPQACVSGNCSCLAWWEIGGLLSVEGEVKRLWNISEGNAEATILKVEIK